LWLARKKAEQDSCNDGTLVQQQKSTPKERGEKKTILTMIKIYDGSGECYCKPECESMRSNPVKDKKVPCTCNEKPDDQGKGIREK
jgi:hypothetical protein